MVFRGWRGDEVAAEPGGGEGPIVFDWNTDVEFCVWFEGNDTATDELSLLVRSFIAAAAPFLPSADADSDSSTLSLS